MADSLEAEERTGRRETLAELYVVDADVHVHEDPGELAEHAVGRVDDVPCAA